MLKFSSEMWLIAIIRKVIDRLKGKKLQKMNTDVKKDWNSGRQFQKALVRIIEAYDIY